MGKQLTLKQFWEVQTSTKLVDRFPPINVPVDEVPCPVQVKTIDVARQFVGKNSAIKRKHVEKRVAQVFGSSVDLNGKPGSDNVHVPGVKKAGRGKGWLKGLGKNQLAQKQLVLNLESGVAQNSEGADPRDVTLLDGKKRRLGRLPMVGTKRGGGEAKLRPGKRSKQQRMVSSEATRSESATETDSDLPQWTREGQSKRDESEEEDSDNRIDLNVLPELLKSAKPKEKNRAQRTRNETEKRRRPAIKRPQIHQQLQLLDRKKADAKQIETRHCSASEETESDREQPRQYRFVASDAMLRRMHTKLPVQRTIIDPDAVHSTAQGVLRNLPLVGDPSDDSETESDDNTGGLIGTSASNSSPVLQKAAQFSVNQLKSERSESFPELAKAVQDLLKAKLLRNAENVTNGKCHVRSSLTGSTSGCSPASNVGSLSALTKKHPSGGPLPRTVVERAKSTRSPQVRSLASRVETDQALTGVKPGRAKREVTFPLQIGALTIVSLGAVVTDSENFHDEQYIWPEGYTSIRTFPSAKDHDIIVEYKLQVFRSPLSRSHPSFRVTPADDTPVEGPSPYACWQRAFQRLRMAHERVGKIPELGVKVRSPAHMFGFSYPRVSKMIQSLPNARACTKFTIWSDTASRDEDVEHVLPAGYLPVDISWKHLDRCTVCYVDEEYVGNLLLQCDKCRILVHMNCYGEVKCPDGNLWLCNLCRPGAPKTRPPCCLCPVTSGGMIKTTDGRWCHIMCAMWIPETYLVDGTEPVDGVSVVAKERWRLTCSKCKVLYGACIQCSVTSCRTAFHPLCARSAGLHMEVVEEKRKSDLRFLAYCLKHKQPTNRTCEVEQPTPLSKADKLPVNASGCARSEPYNAAARRGRREPEALAAALAKRLFVENLSYTVTGCRQISRLKRAGCAYGAESGEDVEILSTSEKFRRMKSSLRQRLVIGKSAIHGMGVFTKQMHRANDMMVEYVGEVIRPVIADLREKRCYDSQVGAGTYMFRIDDERVVDATRAGNIAHLMNHSCEPNCYSRIVTANEKDRIIIFAKRNIEIGEELTYDYKFMSKDDVLTCHCGCVGCRGFVNVVDSDGDLDRLSIPLAGCPQQHEDTHIEQYPVKLSFHFMNISY